MRSATGRQSCSKMALKRCTKTETRWKRKLSSLASPEMLVILLPRSLRRRQADELKTPRVPSVKQQSLQPCLLHELPRSHMTLPEDRSLWRPSIVTCRSATGCYYYYYYKTTTFTTLCHQTTPSIKYCSQSNTTEVTYHVTCNLWLDEDWHQRGCHVFHAMQM